MQILSRPSVTAHNPAGPRAMCMIMVYYSSIIVLKFKQKVDHACNKRSSYLDCVPFVETIAAAVRGRIPCRGCSGSPWICFAMEVASWLLAGMLPWYDWPRTTDDFFFYWSLFRSTLLIYASPGICFGAFNHKRSLCRLLLAIQGKWILAHIHSSLMESLRSMLASFRSAQQPTNQSELFEDYSILG